MFINDLVVYDEVEDDDPQHAGEEGQEDGEGATDVEESMVIL